MMFMRNAVVLFTVLLTITCLTQVGQAANTGSTHIMEGMMGGKYSGAPSQAMAGNMGLIFQELRNDMNRMFPGKIKDAAPLKKLGYKNFVVGDQVEMIRTGENTWRIKHVKSGKTLNLKVVS